MVAKISDLALILWSLYILKLMLGMDTFFSRKGRIGHPLIKQFGTVFGPMLSNVE